MPELISCLLATKDSQKFPLLCKAYRCFQNQTYDNRELVIIASGVEEYTEQIRELAKEDQRVRVEHIEQDQLGLTLGDIRNLLVEYAQGEIIVNWDDDDLNHSERLTRQHQILTTDNADACFMTDQLHFFADTRQLYWVDWGKDLIPGTLMCYKRCFEDLAHPKASHHEDALFRDQLCQSSYKITRMSGFGYLYVYTYNGLNVFERSHHADTILKNKDLSLMNHPEKKLQSISYLREYDLGEYEYIYPYNRFYAQNSDY